MADNKRYLDLNGLGYTIRKINERKADVESPVFTGTPTAPTPLVRDKSNQIATTEFVNKELNRVVQWDNAERGTTIEVIQNMVVLTEDEYNHLDIKLPNTFYFIYDDLEGAMDDNDL